MKKRKLELTPIKEIVFPDLQTKYKGYQIIYKKGSYTWEIQAEQFPLVNDELKIEAYVDYPNLDYIYEVAIYIDRAETVKANEEFIRKLNKMKQKGRINETSK